MDNHYLVSARKYRPESFERVVGQKPIVQTLKNAILHNQLAHAYLFCGPRGVGKTTCARIFAKTINCTALTEQGEACNQCESCLTFKENRSFNIHELDAASNNHVEDIRNLIEQVRIPPQVGKYSVYIIDEVHMLSQSAFNAFLKTLEEPPSHAVFILATTEKHKILPTILSRCQIFDFHRIQFNDIIKQLQTIAAQESVTCELSALNIIAQKADGSMRDALSIYDQAVSFCGNEITYQKVISHLNVLDYEYYFTISQTFLKGDYRASLLIFNEILEKGFDAGNFLSGLATHLRNLLVSKDKETSGLFEMTGELAERYQKEAAHYPDHFLLEALQRINQMEITLRPAKDPRLHVEIGLLHVSKLGGGGVRRKVEEVEKEVGEALVSGTRISEFMALNGRKKDPDQSGHQSHELKSNASATGKSSKDFTQEDLKRVWLAFAEEQREQTRLYHTLTAHIPELNQEGKIVLELYNPLQEKALRSIYHEIVHFIQNQSGKESIELEFRISGDQAKKKLYTQDEKYNHMREKNPDLDLFKQKLNLDLE